jgi:hypothetical protein
VSDTELALKAGSLALKELSRLPSALAPFDDAILVTSVRR